ncbi:hypothetical protein [Conchiformibius kuhniae]|nr:hypothetical protein [Conchiformibius kuhniae]
MSIHNNALLIDFNHGRALPETFDHLHRTEPKKQKTNNRKNISKALPFSKPRIKSHGDSAQKAKPINKYLNNLVLLG